MLTLIGNEQIEFSSIFDQDKQGIMGPKKNLIFRSLSAEPLPLSNIAASVVQP